MAQTRLTMQRRPKVALKRQSMFEGDEGEVVNGVLKEACCAGSFVGDIVLCCCGWVRLREMWILLAR